MGSFGHINVKTNMGSGNKEFSHLMGVSNENSNMIG